MNKEFLKMQKLAGLITESKYRQLLENQEIVDRLLDKISDQGIGSLTPEEREYLDRHSRGEKNIPEPTGPTKAYTSDTDLYKIESFPAIQDTSPIELPCDEGDGCDKNDPDVLKLKKLLSNPGIRNAFTKITNDFYKDDVPAEPIFGVISHGIYFDGDFSSDLSTAYLQIAGDGMWYVVDSLDRFNEGYKTEEDWDVTNWRQL